MAPPSRPPGDSPSLSLSLVLQETEPGHEVRSHAETAEHHSLRRRGASRDRAGFDRPRCRRRRYRPNWRRVQSGGRTPAIGRRPIRHRRFAGGGGRDLCRRSQRSPTRSCARRSASIFPASPTARRAYFALARDGRRIAAIQVSVGRDVAEIVEPAQHRHPRQRNSCAHGREHDHPHRVGRVGRGGSKGARYR